MDLLYSIDEMPSAQAIMTTISDLVTTHGIASIMQGLVSITQNLVAKILKNMAYLIQII